MIKGRFNLLMDESFGSSAKGAASTRLVEKYDITHVSSSNFPNAGHCQTADTYIITDSGLERLGDVVNTSSANSVINMNGCSEVISNFVPDGIRQTNLISLKNGITLECTDQHKYYVWDSSSGRREWIRSIDLDTRIHQFIFPKNITFPDHPLFDGNFSNVAKPNKTNIKQPSDETRFAEYLGLLVGDGYYAKGTRIDIAFHESQVDVLERVQALYNEIGITNINIARVGEKKCFVISINQVSGLLDLLKSVGLKFATRDSKSTPAKILKSNKAVMAAYLRGLFDADGSAKDDRITLTNCARSIITDAQQILYILGIHSCVTKYDDKPGRTGSNRLAQWTLSISGKCNMQVFQQRVGFASRIKSEKLGKCIDDTQDQGQVIYISPLIKRNLWKFRASNRQKTRTSFILSIQDEINKSGLDLFDELIQTCLNYHVVPIKNVVYNNKEVEVFDITVPGTHSYLANGCISHNTAKFSDGTKFLAKAIPTPAILKKINKIDIKCYLSPASGFNQLQLFREWKDTGRPEIFIHERANIVDDSHKQREALGSDSTKHLASTMQGTAAALSDKILRKADTRLVYNSNLLTDEVLQEMSGCESCEKEWPNKVHTLPGLEFRNRVHAVINDGHTWLHEVAQGYALSIDHGYQYPYCTSRNCGTQAAMDQMAIPPKMIGDIYLNLRTFVIRVGNVVENGKQEGYSGDFYPDSKELTWEEIGTMAGMPADEIASLAERERTSVTKRIRRVATRSDICLRDAVRTNGATKLILNFMQYIDWSDAGLHGGKEAFEKLSKKSRAFIDHIEQVANLPVVMIGTGALHHEAIHLE